MDQQSRNFEPQRRWIQQLYKEHHEIAWFYGAGLLPVVIQLAEMTSAWGRWDPFFRTITISVRLIESYSWDVVVEILKHEMAHQYVSEKLSHMDSTHHGDAFKLACKKLGVAAWAARATADLPDELPSIRERVVSADEKRLLDRVEKLLSLAQSSNEHEAFLAMQKSREICARYNFEKIRHLESERSMDSLFLTRKKKRTDPTEAKILSILNDHFKVRVIHTSLYDAKACDKFQAAEILGRRENVLMAEYVYQFLSQQCETLWQSYKKGTKSHGSMRRSYQLGVLSGFDEKLSRSPSIDEKIVQESNDPSMDVKALQKVECSAMDTFVGERYPRLSKKSWGGSRVDQGAFTVGQSAGRRLNINRPIAGRGAFGGYLK